MLLARIFNPSSGHTCYIVLCVYHGHSHALSIVAHGEHHMHAALRPASHTIPAAIYPVANTSRRGLIVI